MLTTAVACLIIAALSMAGAVVALAKIERAKERSRPELERVTHERRQKPLIFLSYRRHDLPKAEDCSRLLEREGYEVVMYDPNSLWDDEIERIYTTIETASAVGYLEGEDSPWIRSEIELSERGRVPLFRFRDAGGLEKLLPDIRKVVHPIDLVQRLLECHPHDRKMIAAQLFGRNVSGMDRHTPDGKWIRSMLPVLELADDPPYFAMRLVFIVLTFAFWAFLAVGIIVFIVYFAISIMRPAQSKVVDEPYLHQP